MKIRARVLVQIWTVGVLVVALHPLVAANLYSESLGTSEVFDPCGEAQALGPDESVSTVLRGAAIDCYVIELRAGEYVKVTVDGIGTGAAAELWLPGTSGEQMEYMWAYSEGELRGSSQVLTAVASIDGTYTITIGPIIDGGPPLPYRIEIAELLMVDQYRNRLQESKSDPRVTWLQEHALRIRSLAPDDDDFGDLRLLKEILAEVDIVMLGEATHWDGPTFHAKTRLVKFLHQEMDFDVLAIENDLYETWKMWEGIKAGEMDMENVYGMYKVREFQPLLEYVQEQTATERPLKLAGMDPHSGWVADKWLEDMETFLEPFGINTNNEPSWESVRTMLLETHRVLGDTYFLPRDYISADEISVFAEQVAALEEVIRAASPDDRMASFWIQTLRNAPNWLERLMGFAAIDNIPPGKYPRPDRENLDWNWCKFGNKDGQMADNLVWLSEEYFSDRKIIVWAHTGHLYRNPYTISKPGLTNEETRCLFQYTRLDDFTVMGHDVYQELGDRIYTVGVISYEGYERATPVITQPINRTQVEELELEELFFLAGHDLAFLDLRSVGEDGNWLHERLYARTAPHRALRARWPAVLDGFLFIRETVRTERLPRQTGDR